MFNSMRVSQRVMRFFLGAALLLMIVPVQASQSIEIYDKDSQLTLGKQLSYFEDPSLEYVLTDVLAEEKRGQGHWQKANTIFPNYGFTESAFWVKLPFINHSAQQQWLLQISYPLMDEIELYVPDDKGQYQHYRP